jgi:hypothetical protein
MTIMMMVHYLVVFEQEQQQLMLWSLHLQRWLEPLLFTGMDLL